MDSRQGTSPEAVEIVDRAITSRQSIRRFRPDPVPKEAVRDILAVASRAPSGNNMQPWRVTVVGGERKRSLSAAIKAAMDSAPVPPMEHQYYPSPFPEPYQSRRRKVGWDLYGALGISKDDKVRMLQQSRRNYDFFDAPVGMIFSIDRVLKIGSWLDYGMFLQNIAIAARARGLDTCMQAAFGFFHETIRQQLKIAQSQVIVCGMSLGYADMAAPENRFSVDREPVDAFASFVGI